MTTTFSYDSTGPGPIDPRGGIHTMVFRTNSGEFVVAQTPFDPPPPEGLVRRLLSFMCDAKKKWDAYCGLLVHNDWSRGEFRNAARSACHLYGLGDPVKRFKPWFRKMLSNFSNAAARKMSRALRRERLVDPQSPSDDFFQRLADFRDTGPGTRWQCMLVKLAHYPDLTRAVVLLLAHRHTWDEIAATLNTTVGKARQAVESYREELQRDFAEFRETAARG